MFSSALCTQLERVLQLHLEPRGHSARVGPHERQQLHATRLRGLPPPSNGQQRTSADQRQLLLRPGLWATKRLSLREHGLFTTADASPHAARRWPRRLLDALLPQPSDGRRRRWWTPNHEFPHESRHLFFARSAWRRRWWWRTPWAIFAAALVAAQRCPARGRLPRVQ